MTRPTIGVEPITPEIRPLLTGRERQTADIRTVYLVVARCAGRRPLVLASGRSWVRLSRVAWELARTHAVRCVPTPALVVVGIAPEIAPELAGVAA